ncbi:MAG: hypothetical protein KME21_19045 [Desmonostoc vinosum HA7617-LM4]|jgi:hypothetical protein|nr:hypothetical protein [Desmonostoc vinosum HA7617-LM4]
MTITPISDDSVQASLRRSQLWFSRVASLFNICLLAQVLTVGIAYFHNPEWWKIHIWLVRGYSWLSLLLLVWVFLNPFPQRVRSLTVSMPVLLGMQFLTIHLKSSLPLAVLHPLIGFMLFSVSTTLVHRARHLVFPTPDDEIYAN